MKKKSLLFLGIFLFFTACEVQIPVREMSAAKQKISKAENWQAKKYAPQLLKQSQNTLKNSHSLLSEEKGKEAKESALEAERIAQQAYQKSLPLYLTDKIKEAETLKREVEILGGQVYDVAGFQKALVLLTQAQELQKAEAWLSGFSTIDEAFEEFKKIKNLCLALVPIFKEQIEKDEQKILQLEENDLTNVAEDDLNSVKQQIVLKKEQIDSLQLKTIKDDLARIEIELKLIDNKIIAINLAQKITQQEEVLASIKKEENAQKYVAEEILFIESSFVQTKEYLKKEKFSLAEANLEKSNQALIEAQVKLTEGGCLVRLQNIESMYQYASELEGSSLFLEDLKTIAEEIAEAKSLLAKKEYQATSEKLNSCQEKLTNLIEKIRTEQQKILVAKEQKVNNEETTFAFYEVKYNPKDRDCLWKIAQRQYKNARLWPLIYVSNKDLIKDPDLIFPGQKLKIPTLPAEGVSEKELKAVRLQQDPFVVEKLQQKLNLIKQKTTRKSEMESSVKATVMTEKQTNDLLIEEKNNSERKKTENVKPTELNTEVESLVENNE